MTGSLYFLLQKSQRLFLYSYWLKEGLRLRGEYMRIKKRYKKIYYGSTLVAIKERYIFIIGGFEIPSPFYKKRRV